MTKQSHADRVMSPTQSLERDNKFEFSCERCEKEESEKRDDHRDNSTSYNNFLKSKYNKRTSSRHVKQKRQHSKPDE